MVASACAWLPAPEERETGTLHMVCVLPEHRGRGLSYPLCLAVLHRFRERGFRRVRLNTHDWRLGAVKVYLRLGFQPLYRHPRHPEQWAGVLRALRWTAPVAPQEELELLVRSDDRLKARPSSRAATRVRTARSAGACPSGERAYRLRRG